MKTKRQVTPAQHDEPKKIYIPLRPSEIDQIDRWGFSKLIRDRSAVIRALVFKGLSAAEPERTAPRR